MTIEIATDNEAFYGLPQESVSTSNADGKCVTAGETAPISLGQEEPKKRTRGNGKRQSMFNTSMRLPREVIDHFDTHFPYSKQAKMREVLLAFVKLETEKLKEINNG